MAKKKHTLGKLFAFTTVAAVIGGTCYIFRDKIKQCGLCEKAADSLASLKNNISSRLHKDNDFFFDDDDKEDDNDLFAGKEQNREYTSITINAKNSEATPNTSTGLHEDIQPASEETETVASNIDSEPVSETASNEDAQLTSDTDSTPASETASDEDVQPTSDTDSTPASEPVSNEDVQPTSDTDAMSASETVSNEDAQPTSDTDAMSANETVSNEDAQPVVESPLTQLTANTSEAASDEAFIPATETAAQTDEPALTPVPEETSPNTTGSSTGVFESSPADEAPEPKEATLNEEITEITENSTNAASQENIWESDESDLEETIPIISFGNSYKPAGIVTAEASRENAAAAEVTGYENEGLSDVSEDPDALEEQDKLDF